MIEITAPVDGKDVTFKFRRMMVEEAVEWASKIRARAVARDALARGQEMLQHKPVLEQDGFVEMGDRIARLEREIIQLTKSLLDWATEPLKDEALRLLEVDVSGVTKVLNQFIEKTLPSEDQRKKS